MDISTQDIRMECLKLAVYSGDESPDECLALCERYVEYVQHGPRKPDRVVKIVSRPHDDGVRSGALYSRQDATSLHATVMGGGYGPGDAARNGSEVEGRVVELEATADDSATVRPWAGSTATSIAWRIMATSDRETWRDRIPRRRS